VNPEQELQRLNQGLSQGLARLRKNRLNAMRHDGFANLRKILLQARSCLEALQSHSALQPSLQAEILRYQNHLRQLAQILPALHGHLLAEKGRLRDRCEHQQRSQAWANAQHHGA